MAFGRRRRGDVEFFRHVGAHLVAKARAVDHARGDTIDIDAVRSCLEREALGDAAQAPFRGRVGHAAGAAAHAEGASDIHDLAALLRDHAGQHRAHGVETALHVEFDDLVEFLGGRLPAGLADRPGTAGHVDQDIDAVAQSRCFPDHVFAVGGLGDIALHHDHLDADGARLQGDRFDRRQITAGQRQVHAFAREGQADRRAHALGRAGDDRYLVAQLQVHGCLIFR